MNTADYVLEGKASNMFPLQQGVVTYMSRVKALATGIRIESSNQSSYGGRSRDQSGLQTAKNQQSRMCGSNFTFFFFFFFFDIEQ